ncbi:MAG: hypothetical protein JWM47_4565 [Acidimicrobiales bacterium]|nr:hypothetical protein [Acidimicrobiales bacterium]
MTAPTEAPPETQAASGLFAKLAEVVTEVTEVSNDARNDHFNYSYTSAEAMLRALRGPLATRGITLLASVTRIDDREYQTSQGKASVITTAYIDFTFTDGATGEQHTCSWAGRGDDQADKGLGNAYTNAIKSFLREQFLIPQGDDPDAGGQGRGDRVPSVGGASSPPGIASQAQQNLIRAKARSASVPIAALANMIRGAGGGDAKTFDTPEAAEQDVSACLARLPWPLVDPVLDLIAAYKPEQDEIPF